MKDIIRICPNCNETFELKKVCIGTPREHYKQKKYCPECSKDYNKIYRKNKSTKVEREFVDKLSGEDIEKVICNYAEKCKSKFLCQHCFPHDIIEKCEDKCINNKEAKCVKAGVEEKESQIREIKIKE